MSGHGDTLFQAARLSILAPRRGAQVVLSQRIGMAESWMVLALVAVLSGLFGALVLQMSLPGSAAAPDPASVDAIMRQIAASPLRFTLFQFLLMAAAALMTFKLGRAAGGTGDLEQSLIVVSWVQMLVLGMQAVVVAVLIVLPILGLVLSSVVPVLAARSLTLFICELHGFRSPWLVFASIVLGFVGLCIAMSVVLVFLGFGG